MIDQVSWILAEIRNGRVIWWGTFRTEADALEAAGRGSRPQVAAHGFPGIPP
jgi:hypothetical protein